MSETDIFADCWPMITPVYEKIHDMVISEDGNRSTNGHPDLPLLIWNRKRILMGQYFCLALLSDPSHGGRGSEARRIIEPIIDESLREEAERRTAAKEDRPEVEKLKQVVEVSLLQGLHGLTSRSVLVYHPQRRVGGPGPVVTTPGQPTPKLSKVRKRESQSTGTKPTSKRVSQERLFKQLIAEEKQSKIDHREDPTKPILLNARERITLIRKLVHEGDSVEDAITKSSIPAPVKPKPKAQVLLQRAIHRTSQGRCGQGRCGLGGRSRGRCVVHTQSDRAEDSPISKQYPLSDDREDGRSRGSVFSKGRLGTQSLSSSLADVHQRPDPRSPSLSRISVFDRLGSGKTAATASPRTSQSPVSVYGSPRGGFSSSSESESVHLSGLGRGRGRGILAHETEEWKRSPHQRINGQIMDFQHSIVEEDSR